MTDTPENLVQRAANSIKEFLDDVWDGNREGWQYVADDLERAIPKIARRQTNRQELRAQLATQILAGIAAGPDGNQLSVANLVQGALKCVDALLLEVEGSPESDQPTAADVGDRVIERLNDVKLLADQVVERLNDIDHLAITLEQTAFLSSSETATLTGELLKKHVMELRKLLRLPSQ